eukprot:TRINITY_DN10534_c0_g1_i21.p1 TRINITY_DN10534_c0_g1~~TRINITY_DN10534_c0_g1_i21.p1  ORF type:complete len:121 (+),score=16.29 TRINITY_DN10534_c0_g1_i21:28-363(+)
MIRRPPRSTHCISSAASDVYKRQIMERKGQHNRASSLLSVLMLLGTSVTGGDDLPAKGGRTGRDRRAPMKFERQAKQLKINAKADRRRKVFNCVANNNRVFCVHLLFFDVC